MSCLTGLHLNFRKSQLVIAGSVLQAVLAWVWIGRFGLAGLACAQMATYVFQLVAAFLVLRVSIGITIAGLLKLDRSRVREIVLFGASLQLPSIGWSLFETSIRFVMSRFGGPVMMGQYEIAYRIAAQPRVLGFYIAQPIGPELIRQLGAGGEAFAAFYRTIYARYSLLAAAAMLGIVVASPITSWVMLGSVRPEFLLFSTLTAIGSASHILAIPSENAAIAAGVLRWNIAGTFSALGLMLVVGIPSGWIAGGEAVAGCVMLASLAAGLIPIAMNTRALHLPFVPGWREERRQLLALIARRRQVHG